MHADSAVRRPSKTCMEFCVEKLIVNYTPVQAAINEQGFRTRDDSRLEAERGSARPPAPVGSREALASAGNSAAYMECIGLVETSSTGWINVAHELASMLWLNPINWADVGGTCSL